MKRFLHVLFLFCILSHGQYACAQPIAADPKQFGERLHWLINQPEASQDEANIPKLFTAAAIERNGMERMKAAVASLRQNLSPSQLHHVDVLSFNNADGSVKKIMHIYMRKTGAKMYNDLQIYLGAQAPYLIDKIAFIAEVAEPVALPNGDIDQAPTLQWLSDYIEKLQKENDLYGGILVVQGNQVLFERYFGYANLEKQQKLDANTLFGMGSGSKMFTALAIAQLVEQGKLRYEDKLTQYFTGFADSKKADQVTLHHLLSHNAGIAEYWTDKTRKQLSEMQRWQDILPLIYEAGFDNEPGTEHHYSNSNFILLGLIIEQVSGMPYFDYVQKFILQPAGMQHTGFYTKDQMQGRYAMPYSRSGAGWAVPEQRGESRQGSGAGGGRTTLHDMLRYVQALRNHKLVREATLMRMTAPKAVGTEAGKAYNYGYGFEVFLHEGGVPAYGHGGTAPGVNFEFRYFPRQDIVLVMACNQDNGAYDDLKRNTIKLITGER